MVPFFSRFRKLSERRRARHLPATAGATARSRGPAAAQNGESPAPRKRRAGALRTRRAALAGLGLLALAACDAGVNSGLGIQQPGAGGPRIDPSRPVPVALLVPRSDPGAGAVATSLEAAARLAIADLQGVQIDLRVYDTAGDPQQAAQVAQAAVDDGARIILGPLFGEAANAAGVAVSGEDVNVLAFSNNPTIAGGNVFILGSTFRNTADRLTGYMARTGRPDLVILHAETVPGVLGRGAIQQGAARNGVSVMGVVGYEPTTESLDAAMDRTADLVSQTGASTVMTTADYNGALANILTLLPEKGVSPDVTTYAGLTRWDARGDAFRLPAMRGALFAMPDPALAGAFRGRYLAANGAAPHELAGLAYDGIAAIGALVATGDRAALTRTSLTQPSGFQGVSGAFRLMPDGTNQRALAVATIQDGQVTVLEPAPRSFRGSSAPGL